MIICGIDFSYTSPAICVYDTDTPLVFDSLKFYNMYKVKKLQGVYANVRVDPYPDFTCPEERFQNIRDWALDIVISNNVEEAVIEGYALGSRAGLIFQIAENTSLLKNALYNNNIPFITPAPTAVKKVFVGKGNASKEDVVDAFIRRTGVDLSKHLGLSDKDKYKKPIDDLCDSFALLHMHNSVDK